MTVGQTDWQVETASKVKHVRPILVIGAQKSRTSYLFNLLEQDPNVARTTLKEPKIFSKPCHDECSFQSFYELRPEHRFAIDASTSYMHVAGTAEHVAARWALTYP